ncbi:molybdenum cofactor biosynthesis prote [Cryphonectria parasitica EP155]|uniref:Molybdenum cofactor biosynthesis prote n=1 Tax=Cryphonectria parasitica (strain ATCC 38755 / EP155) TaxID=660469 RepID=A0A9P4YBE0_CRYP1|nr:molybdenum cofactor biosynthesis prote [Cryphonectria parasitica EP155]KAF3769943.1 molybdenum cofactor biosynthesis prote [Cryphonectria parasitica EP155]
MHTPTRAVGRWAHAGQRPLRRSQPGCWSLVYAVTRRTPSRGTSATCHSGLQDADTRYSHHSNPDLRTPEPPTPPHPGPSPRRVALQDAKPFSDFLTDTFHRQHTYLRISLTEMCNLRCVYCMPEEGVPLSPPSSLLTTPEILLLASTFVSQGVGKIRLTGGEPTVRRDILPLMQQLGELRPHGLRELCITTNGVALHRKLEPMVEAGLTGVNLSLDTLDPWQFQIMTRRTSFDAVQKSITRIHELNRAGAGVKFKINCVVMRGVNDRELLDFVDLTRDSDVEVRFIEYMPFDGNKWSQGKMFSYGEMLNVIRQRYPTLRKVEDHRNDTSKTWHIPGFTGRLGFVTSMTHNFCSTCNRLRITSDGNLKVCLFGNAEVSLRDIVREVNGGEPIDDVAFLRLKKLAMDQQLPALASRGDDEAERQMMIAPNSEQLLSVIGAAVKRKKARHAGMGELKHMKNRPMILIDQTLTPPPRPSVWPAQQYSHLRNQIGPPISHRASLPSSTSEDDKPASTPSSPPQQPSSNTSPQALDPDSKPRLTHISLKGEAHMVSIAHKQPTTRTARAVCSVHFSNPTSLRLIREDGHAKGDVLGVARIAGIMAAKKTPDLVPLCHPIMLSHVRVELQPVEAGAETEGGGRVDVAATVTCDGKTGVEMEALTAASAAALTVYDMCKAVDKGMCIDGLRVVLKEGGKSGRWVEGMRTE